MAAAAQASAAGQLGEVLRRAAGLQIAILIREAHDAVGVANVDPLRIGAGGIEGDAEGLVQAGQRRRRLASGLPSASTPRKTLILPVCAFGEEEIAVGRDAQEPRIVEAGGIELDLEAFGRDRPGVCRARDDGGAVVDGLVGSWCGQIGDSEMAADAGRLVCRVGKSGLAGKNTGC